MTDTQAVVDASLGPEVEGFYKELRSLEGVTVQRMDLSD